MKNSIKSLDVFEFREDEEEEDDEKLQEPTDLRVSPNFSNHDSEGTEMQSKKIAAVLEGDTDAGNLDYNHNAAGSLSNLETDKSTLNHVMRFKFGSSEQSAETKFNVLECDSAPVCLEGQSICVFPEHSNNNVSVSLHSYADGSMSERSSSPTAENSDCSDGQSSEKYFSGLNLDEDNGRICFHSDYIDYSGAHYMNSRVIFSDNSVEVSNKSFEGDDDGTLYINLEIDDIVKIESQWSARREIGTINIYFISKEAVRNDIVYNPRVIEKFEFAVMDSNWHKKQEAIESLNLKYKAVWALLLDTGMERDPALTAGKAWMSPRKYFPDFDKPFDEVIYPKGDPDAVSISKRDIDLLRPDTFVNDTIIDFYIKYLETKLNEEERVKFHFFNSFFFRKLADMDKDPNSAKDARAAFMRVRKWTRKVNFLEKDFIFIPVNYNYHWSVIVICYFGEAGSCEDVDREKSMRIPCILHMDSFKGSHAGLEDLMQSYLWEEWKERKAETCEDSKFKNMKFVSLELPQQPNLYDCGLFLLHYVELFLEDVPMNFNIHKLTSSSKFLQADWFSPDDASLKRAHIERLISDLIDSHSEVYSSSDGRSDLHGSPTNPKTNDVYENGFARLEETSALTSSYHESSVCPDVGQGIEMTLLQASSVRSSTQCTTSSGFVIKELFESGPAPESFSDVHWLDFEGKESTTELKRSDSIIEEIQTGLTEPPSLQHLDVPPTRSDSDNASDTEVKEKCSTEDAELEKPPCMSSEVTEQVSLFEPAPIDVINDAESVERPEGDDSKNMPVLFEGPNESKSESDEHEHHAPKRMRIELPGSL